MQHLKGALAPQHVAYVVLAGGNYNRSADVQDYSYAQRSIRVPFVPTPVTHDTQLDLEIMAQADAVVVSGGSFGFWGAYLNNRRCVAPRCSWVASWNAPPEEEAPPWCHLQSCRE